LYHQQTVGGSQLIGIRSFTHRFPQQFFFYNSPMDLYNFDGQNLSAWLFQLHQCFIYYNTPNDLHKYMFASYHMEGEALDWLVTMERSGVFTMDADWDNFVRLIHLRFGQRQEFVGLPKKLEEISGEALSEATKEHTDVEILKKFNEEDDEMRDGEAKSTIIPESDLGEDPNHTIIPNPDPEEAQELTKITAIDSAKGDYPLFDVTPPRISKILEV